MADDSAVGNPYYAQFEQVGRQVISIKNFDLLYLGTAAEWTSMSQVVICKCLCVYYWSVGCIKVEKYTGMLIK